MQNILVSLSIIADICIGKMYLHLIIREYVANNVVVNYCLISGVPLGVMFLMPTMILR